jgi:DUF1365 family protein
MPLDLSYKTMTEETIANEIMPYGSTQEPVERKTFFEPEQTITPPPCLINNTPCVINGKVMHKRFAPKENSFTYPIYYFSLPLAKLNELKKSKSLKIDRFSLTSFYRKDHGEKSENGDLNIWAYQQLTKFHLQNKVKSVTLISMPRILGFVFNPVSFWLCFDEKEQLRAIIYEVNNTFGETHSYVCAKQNQSVIEENDWMIAHKEFHVSPFLPRDGHYQFRIKLTTQKIGLWIDYYNKEGRRTLTTSLKGKLEELTKSSQRKAFWQTPFVTLQAITLIHWQALKLKIKGVKFFKLPKQKSKNVSSSITRSQYNSK